MIHMLWLQKPTLGPTHFQQNHEIKWNPKEMKFPASFCKLKKKKNHSDAIKEIKFLRFQGLVGNVCIFVTFEKIIPNNILGEATE